MKSRNIVAEDEAVRLIRQSNTAAFDGFEGGGVTDELSIALEKRFLETGGAVFGATSVAPGVWV